MFQLSAQRAPRKLRIRHSEAFRYVFACIPDVSGTIPDHSGHFWKTSKFFEKCRVCACHFSVFCPGPKHLSADPRFDNTCSSGCSDCYVHRLRRCEAVSCWQHSIFSGMRWTKNRCFTRRLRELLRSSESVILKHFGTF